MRQLLNSPSSMTLSALLAATGCTADDAAATTDDSSATSEAGETGEPLDGGGYVLASVVISDAGRTTYLSVVPALDGHLDNSAAIEIPGNAVYLVAGRSLFVGLSESPTWVKYDIDEDGSITEVAQMSLANYGLAAVDFGNVLVDASTAVSVSSDALLAIVWDPTTMTITGTVDLSHLQRDGYDLENWTTSVGPDGLVYIPGRWADWQGARIYPEVSLSIVDAHAVELVAVASDDRCVSGGRPVFSPDGHAYVLGDGRNYSAQMFENAGADPAPDNCLLRIAPGETSFDPEFYVPIPSLTGGLEAITELDTASASSGLGFVKIFDPDKLPAGVEPIDFEFWDENAHRMWRLELGDEPVATPVDGAPYSAIGFPGVATEGRLYIGESEDGGATSQIYAIDPEANTMAPVFTMDGYFYGAHALD